MGLRNGVEYMLLAKLPCSTWNTTYAAITLLQHASAAGGHCLKQACSVMNTLDLSSRTFGNRATRLCEGTPAGRHPLQG
jgi:hypothetical protein